MKQIDIKGFFYNSIYKWIQKAILIKNYIKKIFFNIEMKSANKNMFNRWKTLFSWNSTRKLIDYVIQLP